MYGHVFWIIDVRRGHRLQIQPLLLCYRLLQFYCTVLFIRSEADIYLALFYLLDKYIKIKTTDNGLICLKLVSNINICPFL